MAAKIDCKGGSFGMVAQKVSLSATILDKIKTTLDLDKELIGRLNSWTSYALSRARQECELYKASNGDPIARKRYEDELDKLDSWVTDITKVLVEYGALEDRPAAPTQADPKAAGKGDGADKAQAKKDIESTIKTHADEGAKVDNGGSTHDLHSAAAMLSVLNTLPNRSLEQDFA